MKKIIAVLIVCLSPFVVDAGCFWSEFKGSYYRFNSKHTRNVFGDGTVYYQGELNYLAYPNIALFLDGGYFKAEGDAAKLRVVPITLGGKYVVPFYDCSAYVGGGLRTMPFNLQIRGKELVRTELGGMLCTGLNLCFKGFLFNPFIEYSFNKRKFGKEEQEFRADFRRQLDFSGWSAGAGLGYMF